MGAYGGLQIMKKTVEPNALRSAAGALAAAAICLSPLSRQQAACAQDVVYPDPQTNPYQVMPVPPEPQAGQTGSVPWPYNPLGTPVIPMEPKGVNPPPTPVPTMPIPPNLVPPSSLPPANPSGQWPGPGYTPPPTGAPPTGISNLQPGTAQPNLPWQPGSPAGGAPAGETAPEGAGAPGEGEGSGEGKAAAAEGKAGAAARKGKEGQAQKKGGEEKAEGKEKTGQEEEKTAGGEKEGKEKAKKEEKKQPFTVTAYDPVREAVFELNQKQYNQSLSTLNRLLAANPNHPQARYVRAVVNVMMRNYPAAAQDYREVIRLSPNSDLGRRAAEGLKKISL